MAWRLRLHRWRFALGVGFVIAAINMFAQSLVADRIHWGWGLVWWALVAAAMIPLGHFLAHESVRVYRYEQQVKAERAARARTSVSRPT